MKVLLFIPFLTPNERKGKKHLSGKGHPQWNIKYPSLKLIYFSSNLRENSDIIKIITKKQ